MTTTDLDTVAAAQEEVPPSQDSDAGDGADQSQDENERERELQRRLTQQGREAADARREAAYAKQQSQALSGTVTELHAQVRLLTESMSEQQRQDQARKQQELDAYLKTLPPEQRLDRKIEILSQQVEQLRKAATPSRPSQPAAPQPQQHQAPQPSYSEQESVEYMRQRAVAIVNEAQTEFGIKVDVSTFDDSAWETEESFYRAVMRTAASQSQNGGTDVPKKPPANETPQQMQQRIRREVEEQLGVSSPNGPKGTPRKTGKPTDEDVRAHVNGYQSAKGPKASVAKLRELRERMG
jgi:hypothetical protein